MDYSKRTNEWTEKFYKHLNETNPDLIKCKIIWALPYRVGLCVPIFFSFLKKRISATIPNPKLAA